MLVLPLLQHVGVLLEQLDRQQDQVVEVHRVVGLERALVVQVDDARRSARAGCAPVSSACSGQDQVVLPGADHGCLISSTPSSPWYSFCRCRGSGLDVLSSKIEKPACSPACACSLRMMFRPRLWKVRHRQALGPRRRAAGWPTRSFISRAALLVKVTATMFWALDAAVLDQVGDLAGDHAGLAGAGAGQHQQGAVDVVHGFLLSGIESGHGYRAWKSRAGDSSRGRRALQEAVTHVMVWPERQNRID